MKSNKALAKGITQETKCRHGFHEWMDVSAARQHKASQAVSSLMILKCRHCDKQKPSS